MTKCRVLGLAMTAIGLLTAGVADAAAQRYALLVGVGAYKDTQTPSLKLEGPPNDVKALQEALNQWGFDRIEVLADDRATRARILERLDDLVEQAKPGSHVLFYFSGHGTSGEDPKFGDSLSLPHTSGALLPYDAIRKGARSAILDSLIIGRRDLRPRFEKLDRKGVYVTAWIDSCYSENSTHSLGKPNSRVALGFVYDSEPGSFSSGSLGYEPYPYQKVVTFSASAANQTADDLGQGHLQQYPTLDSRTHGAFSDAVLRALNDRSLPGYGALDKNGDNIISVEEFTNGVGSFMANRKYSHQPKLQPMAIEDSGGMRNQPLFLTGQWPPLLIPAPPKPVPAILPEPQRRQKLLDQIISVGQQSGRATVVLELAHPYASSRLPIGDKDHLIKADLVYKADQPGYPLVIDLFSDGQVQWLYPAASENDRKRRGEWQQALSAREVTTLWAAKTLPPPGIDTIYTFLLDQPLLPALITDKHQIMPTDGGQFDELVDQLSKPGRVLGAHRLALEVYQPLPGELENWKVDK